ncbi:unnamed protein product [Zymoseptoria tritici ST99CH_1A5]|uniref:Inosine/uridine-preferring nucleoside hydrolase domain-containing protein n=1 Tax=Zymoseptoria tritici ST99CH_1A5 TaxID=1276529 RepID=A0A1Y6LH17_ZYMTR|nr:unnamed protein product [Zymoseptoria tritici ST99CH_1A5]
MTSPTPIPLWLDLDTGHDDAFALLLAAHNPVLYLLGCSTVYGNAPLSHTTSNTLSILTALHRTDIPVYPGASKPFCRAEASAADIHGESGLDGTTLLPAPAVDAKTDVPAVEAMYTALMVQPKGAAWIVATGCLTNIALLFAIHPDLVDHIAGLSIMGGAVGDGFTDAPMGTVKGESEDQRFGNWTRWAEFNIYIDPESAAAVFSNPILAKKTTLVTLDLTHQFLATKEVQEGLVYGFDRRPESAGLGDGANEQAVKPSDTRNLFLEILTFFAKTYAEVFGLTAGPPLHDPLAVAALLPELLFYTATGTAEGEEERFEVSVVTEGEHGAESHVRNGGSQCGRTVVRKLDQGEEGVRVPRGVDGENMWKVLEGCLGSAEAQSR